MGKFRAWNFTTARTQEIGKLRPRKDALARVRTAIRMPVFGS